MRSDDKRQLYSILHFFRFDQQSFKIKASCQNRNISSCKMTFFFKAECVYCLIKYETPSFSMLNEQVTTGYCSEMQ